MLHQMVTTFVTMMMYCSTSTTPSSSASPPLSDADPPARLASSRPAQRTYLARGMTGRVQCPAKDDPPHRLIIWSRSGRTILSSDDVDDSEFMRFSVDLGGVLVVEDAQFSDTGDYRCTLYSPNDAASRRSFVVRVVVKGKCSFHPKLAIAVSH